MQSVDHFRGWVGHLTDCLIGSLDYRGELAGNFPLMQFFNV